MPKTILHLIDSFQKGGAETLLAGYLPELSGFNNIIAVLNDKNDFQNVTGKYPYYNLNIHAKRQIPAAVRKIKKICKDHHIDILHSHSLWTIFLSRKAANNKQKVINHYHFADYQTYSKRVSTGIWILIDRLTYGKNVTRVAVSEYVLNILNRLFKKTSNVLIPNFIEGNNSSVIGKPIQPGGRQLKMIAVGGLKHEKNYDTIIEAFRMLKDSDNISIDIFGGGELLKSFREKTFEDERIHFKGQNPDIQKIWGVYDLYVSSSTSETFGMALLEAVKAGLPALVSDIPAFREVAPKGTMFFSTVHELAESIRYILKNGYNVDESSYLRQLQKFSKERTVEKLKQLYLS